MEVENKPDSLCKFTEFQQLLETENSQKTIRKPSPNRFTQAMSQLNESAIPKSIPCREKEKTHIRTFIQEGIQNIGSTSTLYISGVPGIGKTVTVMEILDGFRDVKDTVCITINAMVLPRPDRIYNNLLNKLTGRREPNSARALLLLNQMFQTGLLPLALTPDSREEEKILKAKIGMTKVIFLDEVDYLCSRSEDVLYNLFEWTQYQYSKIVMVAVSNTIDLPERLQDKILSRIGNSRLVFRPYNNDQIEIILRDRIQAIDIFDSEAVSYACKKVARFSSDIRKCLQVLSTAIELFMKAKKGTTAKISIDFITQAHESLYEDSSIKMLKCLPDMFKKVLVNICVRVKSTGKYCWFSELEQLMNMTKYECSNLGRIVLSLRDLNIIKVKYTLRNKDRRLDKSIRILSSIKEYYIELMVELDQITNAFRDELELINDINRII